MKFGHHATLEMERPYWTEERQRLNEWIAVNGSGSFAELYKGAVILLFERNPGYLRFVSHAARDLMNGMPSAKLGLQRKQVQYVRLVEALKETWDSCNLSLGSVPTVEVPSFAETPDIEDELTIPKEVVEKIRALLTEHEEGRGRNEKSPFLFFQAFLPGSDGHNGPSEAFSAKWRSLQKWFHSCAHEGGGGPSQARLDLLKNKFEELEQIMLAVADSYVKTLGRIDEILDQANR